MPIKATLRDDNTLELPEDAPRLAQTNTPLSVIDLGGGTFVVTESEPQIPGLAEKFREKLGETGVEAPELLGGLDDVKRELAEEDVEGNREREGGSPDGTE
ncbi:hypothetical protein BSZ35_19220 [Salinibacter sp. 10B]|uniref:hypothetical protein n=1 Tax=Salinibacter sp. 10B TaxID=1923971 RepID=UPI000CF55C84|nr:hypothetical protein [Salinibacter sp. 10B]PQJ26723.1 hypothetical protein BSZ35_19220 [Salinibacter sp. 10B]